MTENKPDLYLIYAIGEVVLVVVGILIALQIDNWNEAHNLRRTEVLLLKEMKANLEADMAETYFSKNTSAYDNFYSLRLEPQLVLMDLH